MRIVESIVNLITHRPFLLHLTAEISYTSIYLIHSTLNGIFGRQELFQRQERFIGNKCTIFIVRIIGRQWINHGITASDSLNLLNVNCMLSTQSEHFFSPLFSSSFKDANDRWKCLIKQLKLMKFQQELDLNKKGGLLPYLFSIWKKSNLWTNVIYMMNRKLNPLSSKAYGIRQRRKRELTKRDSDSIDARSHWAKVREGPLHTQNVRTS